MSNLKEAVVKGIRKILPEMWFEFLWDSYVAHNPKYETNRYRWAYFQKGEKNKKRYCILRYSAPGMGLFAAARNCLLACEWAEKHGMFPIIDFEFEYFFKYNMVGKENMWDYVFEQEVSVQEIYEQYSVFVGEIDKRYFLLSMSEKLLGSKEENLIKFKTEDWRKYYRQLNIYSNKWWTLRPEIKERFENKYAELFRPEMKILGVALREEFSMTEKDIDMKKTELGHHPHHLAIDGMIDVIKEYKQRWRCTHVFVTTYMEDSIEKLQGEFGDALLCTNRGRVSFEKYKEARKIVQEYLIKSVKESYEWINSGSEFAKIMNMWSKEITVEYTEEIYGLSLCDCLLSGKSGGALAACIWNGGKYKELEIIADENESKLY